MASTTDGPRAVSVLFLREELRKSDLIIAGQGRSVVCYDCIRVLSQLINRESPPMPARPARPPKKGPLVPREIYDNLETYVVAQEKAKKILSVAVYNHFKRIWNGAHQSEVELQKPTSC